MKHLSHIQIDQIVLHLKHKTLKMYDCYDHIINCYFCSKRIEESFLFETNLSHFIKENTSLKQKEFVEKIFQSDSHGKVTLGKIT